MKNLIRTFLSGALVVVPVAITAYVLYSMALWLDSLGLRMVTAVWPNAQTFPGAGALLLIAVIYLTGLLTRLWIFRRVWDVIEGLLAKVPGVKVIYESVRDLMKLFGGGAASMGRVVEYRPPGTDVAVLGILTNEHPIGVAPEGQPKRVAVYLPLAYMLGGPTILTTEDNLTDVDMPVEHALKLAATAYLGSGSAPETADKKEK
jgi:uncharacterized membrane protein